MWLVPRYDEAGQKAIRFTKKALEKRIDSNGIPQIWVSFE